MQMFLFDDFVQDLFQTPSGVNDISGSMVKNYLGTHSDQTIQGWDIVKVAKMK